MNPVATERPDAALGAAVCAAIRRQVEKLGLALDADEPQWDEAGFIRQIDPFSQEEHLIGTWRGKARFGTVTVFADGRVFAEYQVLKPHPQRPDSYVDAVQVWGPPDALKGDAVIAEYLK